MSKFNSVILSWPAVLTLIALTAFPFGSAIESRLLPVVRDFHIEEVSRNDTEVLIDVTFRKVRPCEFVAITFYRGAARVPLNFAPDSSRFPVSRPVGDQVARWTLETNADVSLLRAVTEHRCHPLWTTFSEVYP